MLRYVLLALLSLAFCAKVAPGTAFLSAHPAENWFSTSGGDFKISSSSKLSGYLFLLERAPKSSAKWQRRQDLQSLFVTPTEYKIFVPGPFRINWNYCLCLEGDDNFTYHAAAYKMSQDGRLVMNGAATIWPANVEGRIYTEDLARGADAKRRSTMKLLALAVLGMLGLAAALYAGFTYLRRSPEKGV